MAGTKPVDLTGVEPRGLRFLVLEGFAAEALRPAPRRALEAALDRLAAAGMRIERADLPVAAEISALTPSLFPTEGYARWGEAIEANPGVMFAQIRERFRAGRDVPAVRYLRDRARMLELRRVWAASVQGHDAVLLATSPILPPDAARLLADDDYYVTENLLALRNTRLANLLGLPSVTLPAGVPSCGLMAMGRAGEDGALLRTARALELALGR
jgi:aspartyl-tRNA(Asn)/glutamyl-tRNA(Gln) amidotransferase subunit A